MSDSILTPRQTFTISYKQDAIASVIKYISDELPIYKFLEKNEALNSIRISITRGIQPQHLDIRFQESTDQKTTFEIEVAKHTGGMPNDDSLYFANQNLDEFMSYLIKCLNGYKITEKEKDKTQNQRLIYILGVGVIAMAVIWWIGWGVWW